MRSIELLAPARNVAIAREAILHGADAVYIGAPRYGARAAAGNSVEEIRELVDFAHVYRVRVYVTLNTILYDEELEDVRQLVFELYKISVDALIVQDMAFLEMDRPPIPLHASTQMDNRTSEKVALLHGLGFEQVVLARELDLEEVKTIHRAVPDVKLEAFVHGATCVSFNGQCYASQYCFGRSANRGECAQFCRLPFDLVGPDGDVVCEPLTKRPIRQRYLLSMHDMNRSADVEAMMEAGIVSFKIEGRLKDEAYVKNVTAYYRQCIDEVIRRYPDKYQRSSIGITAVSFVPQLDRTFNRGFSSYFLHGRSRDMAQLFSPKSLGQFVGHVKEVRRNCFTVSTTVPFSNGDGLCYLDAQGNLQGFRVNRVEGNCLFPKDMPEGIAPRTLLYRNFDQAFTQQLTRPTAERRISVKWTLTEKVDESQESGILVSLYVLGENIYVSRFFATKLEEARTPQYDNIVRQLSRLGETPFVSASVEVNFTHDWFVPSSLMADWRRLLTLCLIVQIKETMRLVKPKKAIALTTESKCAFKGQHLSYLANVSNTLARQWYESHGAESVKPAMEKGGEGNVIMTLRYCPRYELGMCGRMTGELFLRSADRNVFPLRFNCKECIVQVLAPVKFKK